MTAIDILLTAAKRAESGIAIGKGYDGRNYCTAALILTTAKGSSPILKGQKLEVYLEARRAFAVTLGIPDTYDAIVEWNDAHRNTKQGIRVHYRRPKEVADKLREAARGLQEVKDAAKSK